ncbi:MAG: ATP-binding protein [Gemmobacter sp.]|nr:ATP-binding protein [Gemmobacter sp.]
MFPAEPLAVRAAVGKLFDHMPTELLSEDERGTAEIVIAEVLNNIVEHAYAGAPGNIDLTLDPTDTGLNCVITDQGRPMPDGVIPIGVLPTGVGLDQPEGGFGWYMIRALSRDISYNRRPDGNCLTFHLPRRQAAFLAGFPNCIGSMTQ